MNMLILKSIILWRNKNTLLWREILRRTLLLFNIRHFLFHHWTNIRKMWKTKFRWNVNIMMIIFVLVHNISKVFTLVQITFLAQVILLTFDTFVPSTNYWVNFTIVTKVSMVNIIISLLFCVLFPFLQLLKRNYSALWFVLGLANFLVRSNRVKRINLVKRCLIWVLKIKVYFFILLHITQRFLTILTEVIFKNRHLILQRHIRNLNIYEAGLWSLKLSILLWELFFYFVFLLNRLTRIFFSAIISKPNF